MLRVAERYGSARLEAACAGAIAVGDPGYRTVKGILTAGTEGEGELIVRVPAAPANLHGQATLFEGLGTGAGPDSTEEATR